MSRISKISGVLVALVFSAMWVAPAQAQATRTWVSGVGDDVNPCSRTAPCKTFPGAISKTAAGGEIDVLDPGGFGTVTITKSMTLDTGGGPVGSLLNTSGTTGVIVNAGVLGTVMLRNLTINGAGSGLSGIRVITCGTLHIVNTIISGNTGSGVDISPTSGNTQVFMNNDYIRDNTTNGILVKGSGGLAVQLTIDNVMLANNGGSGLRVEDGGKAGATRLTVTGSTNGINAVSTSTASAIVLKSSMVSGNSNGLVTSGANASIVISDVAIYNNVFAGISSPTGTVYTFGNNYNANNGVVGPVHSPALPLQ